MAAVYCSERGHAQRLACEPLIGSPSACCAAGTSALRHRASAIAPLCELARCTRSMRPTRLPHAHSLRSTRIATAVQCRVQLFAMRGSLDWTAHHGRARQCACETEGRTGQQQQSMQRIIAHTAHPSPCASHSEVVAALGPRRRRKKKKNVVDGSCETIERKDSANVFISYIEHLRIA